MELIEINSSNINESNEVISLLLSNAKYYCNCDHDEDNGKKNNYVSMFINESKKYSDCFGEYLYIELLQSFGLNDYEISCLVLAKNSQHLDVSLGNFFSNMDWNLEYKSPLSKNIDWLVSSEIKKESLSDEYAALIDYIFFDFQPNEIAEILAIIDCYVRVNSQNIEKLNVLNVLKNFDCSNEEHIKLLVDELNNFGGRFTVDQNSNVTKSTKEIFKIGKKGFEFKTGGKNETDFVFKDLDGNYGLICSTSKEGAKDQHQLYKFRKAIIKYLKPINEIMSTSIDIIPYIYCDSTFKEEKVNGKRASKIAKLKLNQEEIEMLNLVSVMRVCAVNDVEDMEFVRETIGKIKVQFFNNSGGDLLKDLPFHEKIMKYTEAIRTGFGVMNKDSNFWINNKNTKDIQKKLIIDLCHGFVWCCDNELYQCFDFDSIHKTLSEFKITSDMNLSIDEKQWISSAKRLVGVKIKSMFGHE